MREDIDKWTRSNSELDNGTQTIMTVGYTRFAPCRHDPKPRTASAQALLAVELETVVVEDVPVAVALVVSHHSSDTELISGGGGERVTFSCSIPFPLDCPWLMIASRHAPKLELSLLGFLEALLGLLWSKRRGGTCKESELAQKGALKNGASKELLSVLS